jgi:hypothetical protein
MLGRNSYWTITRTGPRGTKIIGLISYTLVSVFAAYHRARPYYRPVPDWSRMHINGGSPAIGIELIYQESYYNEWETPVGGRMGNATSLVTLKCSTFKLKFKNTSMNLCKAKLYILSYVHCD